MDTPAEQTDPVWPQVEERNTYDLVTMPSDWPVEPLQEECAETGREILRVRVRDGLARIRISKVPPGREPTEEPEEFSTETLAESLARPLPPWRVA
jgi:hypothetical protein